MNSIGPRDLAVRAVYGILAIVAIQVFVATPLLAARLMFGMSEWMEWLVGAIFAGALLALLFFNRERLRQLLPSIGQLAARPPLAIWLGIALAVGMALRLVWVWLYPAAPASDGAIYLTLATGLAQGEPYEIAGSRAYWPPGYPLLLTPLISLFGAGREMVISLNLFLFAGSLLAIYGLGRVLAGDTVGRMAAALFAIWPTHIALTGLPYKELPVILIVTASLLLLYARPSAVTALRSFLAGATLGLGSLIQPSLLLIPFVFLLIDLLRSVSLRKSSLRLLLVLLGMVLVVSPWTIRNYHVFDQFVLISTNGGGVLYRANNPLATGDWTPRGEVDLDAYSELEANALGSKLAKEWIRENPLAFLRLAVEKQTLFLGDDSSGMYASLRRGGLHVNEMTYAAWKALANAYWLGVWILVFLFVSRWATHSNAPPAFALPLMVPFLYLYALHSVFESDGKYHLPMIGLLAILAALPFTDQPAAGRPASPIRE